MLLKIKYLTTTMFLITFVIHDCSQKKSERKQSEKISKVIPCLK